MLTWPPQRFGVAGGMEALVAEDKMELVTKDTKKLGARDLLVRERERERQREGGRERERDRERDERKGGREGEGM
jgi:hypothetical protein